MKESFVNGLYLSGPRRAGLLRPGGQRPERRPDRVEGPARRRRALRRRAQAVVDEITPITPPTTSTTRPSRAVADLERVHRRPLPGRRGDPLLQPHPYRAPEADLALFFGDFGPPARAEQGRRQRPARGAPERLARPLRRGLGSEPPQGVEAMTETCPHGAPSGGPFTAAQLGADGARARSASRAAASARSPRDSDQRRHLRPGLRRRRLRDRRRRGHPRLGDLPARPGARPAATR